MLHVRFDGVDDELTEPAKLDLETPDVAAAHRAAFEQQFPGVLADGVVDAERLKELLDVDVIGASDDRERYGLMWAGKKEAVRSLQTSSRATLVPDIEASVQWDSAQNVFIEGDNLEVLKLLQKAYNDQVKLIYIDPPYNTGNEFVYNDDFADGLRGYLKVTGQLDDEGNLTSSADDRAGRKHSRWLSMMYPRLMLARNLLQQDGAIFVSIDDNEVHHLRELLDEVFGQENWIGQISVVSNLKGRSDDRFFATAHSYLLAYRRSDQFVPLGVELDSDYVASYKEVDELGRFRQLPLRKAGTNSLRSDRPNMYYPFFVDPISGAVSVEESRQFSVEVYPKFPDGRDGRWRWGRDTARERSDEIVGRRVGSAERWDVFQKDYLHREGAQRRAVPKTVWTGPEFDNGRGTNEIKNIFGDRVFDGPKPTSLVMKILEHITDGADVVLDFFAGSGTTAHAVALQNAADGGRRRTISVNLPEPTPRDSLARKAGFETISALTETRIKRVMESDTQLHAQGLRVERLGRSNFRDSMSADTEGLFDLHESTLGDRDHDLDHIAQEVLLKEGIRLDATWDRHEAAGAPVIVADGVAAVMSFELTQEVVEAAMALAPNVIVFLEDGFAGADAVKANAFTHAKNAGIVMKTV